jgi:Na+-driven multidrug efflux pump
LILLPSLNIIGAAIASLLSYMLIVAILFWILRRQMGLSVKELLIPNRQDLTLVGQKLVVLRTSLVKLGK